MKLKRIFLDLDDVLNTFTPYILSRLGCHNTPTCYKGHPREAGWDIVDAANRLNPSRTFTHREFWREVSREHWASVPRSHEFSALLRLSIDAVGRDNVYVLTQATLDPQCLAGKKEWLQRNCPDWLANKYLVVGEDCKHVCAQPGSLLVDDNEKNVEAFALSGGQSVLMPRPWNTAWDVEDTEAYLCNAIRWHSNPRRSCYKRCYE